MTLERAMDISVKNDKDNQRQAAVVLLRAIAEQRDRQAFVALFGQFGPRVKAYILRLGTDYAQADDLVQEVMLTVWRRAEQFDPAKASPSTWIFTIARNRRIDFLRRERRPEFDPTDPALVPEPETAADDQVDAGQKQKLIRAAVRDLPEEQAQLLKLAYFEDKSHSVIAEQLDLPLGTVKSRLRLAITKLRAALKDIE